MALLFVVNREVVKNKRDLRIFFVDIRGECDSLPVLAGAFACLNKTPDTPMNVILETLSNGLFRCTVRHHGATMSFVDHSNPKQAVLAAMKQGAAGHMLQDGSFDMTHLQLNDAAKQALAQAPDWAVLGPKLAEAMRGVEGLLYEAQSDIPAEMRAKRDVLAALEIVRANLPAA
jgi:hypothetical protein